MTMELTIEELGELIRKIMPNAVFNQDSYTSELTISTGLQLDEDGNLVGVAL